MKTLAKGISLLIILGLFVGCEKFELDDHCPENEHEVFINPQDLRVNDDSDREDELAPGHKTLSASDGDLELSTTNLGNQNGGGTGDDSSDDLVNDDSDDEDEGVRPRIPGNPSGLGGGSGK